MRIIVKMKQSPSPLAIRMLRRELGQEALPVRRRLAIFSAFSTVVSRSCLDKLCNCKGVEKVYLDRKRSATLHVASPAIGAPQARRFSGLTGKGVNIAIVDTGVYPHPDLIRPLNRIVAFKDFVNGRKHPYDDNGHGTHLAGDAAGNGWASKGKYAGAAPESGIVGVKVLDALGDGYDSDIIAGIEWTIANRKRFRIRILSLSLGGPAVGGCQDDLLCQAVERAVRSGIVVVAAAGNNGPGQGTIESPGNSPSAITVGAVDDRRTIAQADDRLSWYSSRGPAKGGLRKPDLVAPGESITSLRAPSSALDRELAHQRVGRRYFYMSGTSVSTPLVAGAAALLLQRCPSLTPSQVKTALKRGAFRLGLGANAGGSGEANARFLIGRSARSQAARRQRN
ncbi:S8 family peptidase [Paenibacillus methanolicus]|uniref:Serine protease AprX n=1 Tax=Paenibacillus methanolicus TaxID=582686 RepID=A0A5S5CL20_9BACL|nr:S8 family peptidase [Paenibacillus methanolicus]TYP79078.1 serine protease AprX [Paenibacillus methanolicus]